MIPQMRLFSPSCGAVVLGCSLSALHAGNDQIGSMLNRSCALDACARSWIDSVTTVRRMTRTHHDSVSAPNQQQPHPGDRVLREDEYATRLRLERTRRAASAQQRGAVSSLA